MLADYMGYGECIPHNGENYVGNYLPKCLEKISLVKIFLKGDDFF